MKTRVRVLSMLSMFSLYQVLTLALHGAAAAIFYVALYGCLPEDSTVILFSASGGVAGVIGLLLLWLASRH
jgi:hypothetical protein